MRGRSLSMRDELVAETLVFGEDHKVIEALLRT